MIPRVHHPEPHVIGFTGLFRQPCTTWRGAVPWPSFRGEGTDPGGGRAGDQGRRRWRRLCTPGGGGRGGGEGTGAGGGGGPVDDGEGAEEGEGGGEEEEEGPAPERVEGTARAPGGGVPNESQTLMTPRCRQHLFGMQLSAILYLFAKL